MSNCLPPKYVRIPQGASLRDIVERFQRRWGFPHMVGVIDGSHANPEANAEVLFLGSVYACQHWLAWKST